MASIIRVDDLQDSGGNSYLSSDGSGTFTTSGLGIDNTPSFTATLSGDTSLSDDTVTLIPCNTEVFDTDNAYDNTAGNYKFTPQVAGKYFVFVYAQANASSGQAGDFNSYIYKNGSQIHVSEYNFTDGSATRLSATASSIVDMNGSTDYIQGYVLSNIFGGSTTLKADTNKKTRFGAFRIIGA